MWKRSEKRREKKFEKEMPWARPCLIPERIAGIIRRSFTVFPSEYSMKFIFFSLRLLRLLRLFLLLRLRLRLRLRFLLLLFCLLVLFRFVVSVHSPVSLNIWWEQLWESQRIPKDPRGSQRIRKENLLWEGGGWEGGVVVLNFGSGPFSMPGAKSLKKNPQFCWRIHQKS